MYQNQTNKIKKIIKSRSTKFVFVLAQHGLGKTHQLEELFSEELKHKKRKIHIERIDLLGLKTEKDVMMRLIGFCGKAVILITVIFATLLLDFLVRKLIPNKVFEDNSFYPSFITLLIGSILFFLNQKKAAFLYKYYYFLAGPIIRAFNRRIFNSEKIIWIDDLERCSLSRSSEWNIIENLTASPYKFLITIGYSTLSEEQDYTNRIAKFSDNLKQNGKDLDVRRFYFHIDYRVNKKILWNYFDKNFWELNPFKEDSFLSWLGDITPREVSNICVKIDNSLKGHLGERANKLDRSDKLKFLLIFSFREFLIFYYERFNLPQESPLDCFRFILIQSNGRCSLWLGSANNHDLHSYKLFNRGFNIKIDDILESLIPFSINKIGSEEKAFSFVWNNAGQFSTFTVKPTSANVINDLITAGIPNSRAEEIFESIELK